MKRIRVPNGLWVISGVIFFTACFTGLSIFLAPWGVPSLPLWLWGVAAVSGLFFLRTTPARPLESRHRPPVRPPSTTSGVPLRIQARRRLRSARIRHGPDWLRTPIVKRGDMRPLSYDDPVFGIGRTTRPVTKKLDWPKLPIPKPIWVFFGVIAFTSSVLAIANALSLEGLKGPPFEVWWITAGAWFLYGFTTPRRGRLKIAATTQARNDALDVGNSGGEV